MLICDLRIPTVVGVDASSTARTLPTLEWMESLRVNLMFKVSHQRLLELTFVFFHPEFTTVESA